jgi:hypothetical protein
MTTAERILGHKHSNRPFTVYLSDGRAFDVKTGEYVSLNPSGKGSNITVYGPGEDEEHFIPLFAVSSVSIKEDDASHHESPPAFVNATALSDLATFIRIRSQEQKRKARFPYVESGPESLRTAARQR